jgi:photosystem II stability/assembly factor-like uncharacterized protein
MRKVLLLVVINVILVSTTGRGQWRKIADFDGLEEYIHCVYFIDLSGPPRIGFAGTASQLWRTSNGGESWNKVWGNGNYWAEYVTGICFKDSLTGWFAFFSGGASTIYRTRDGGLTWDSLPSSKVGGPIVRIYYLPFRNRLFATLHGIDYSDDLGDTWKTVSKYSSGNFAFFNDSVGLVSSYVDSINELQKSTDGGLTWHGIPQSIPTLQELTIPGTSIAYIAGDPMVQIFRSDDYGESWKVICDFGPPTDTNFNTIAPSATGVIYGDLSRLYIQTDSGMFVSFDQGYTWKKESGPDNYGRYPCFFYSAKGKTICARSYLDGAVYSGGLWEEDWPQSDVEVMPSITDGSVSFNPSSNSTSLCFSLQKAGYVSIRVYDLLGREVGDGLAHLYDPGEHIVPIDLENAPAGTYFAHVMNEQVGRAVKISVQH